MEGRDTGRCIWLGVHAGDAGRGQVAIRSGICSFSDKSSRSGRVLADAPISIQGQ